MGSIDRAKLDGWCERGILALVLGIVVFSPLALGAVRLSEFLVVEVLTGLVLVLWALRFWLKHHRLLWAPVCWPMLLLLGYACVRYVTADVEYIARQELLRLVVYVALFFAILNNLHRQGATRLLALTIIGLGTAIALYALYQWLTNSNQVWHFSRPLVYLRRGSGTYICPNHLAGFLELLVPLALAYTITGRFSALWKILWGYGAAVMLVGVAVSVSWGSWLSLSLALLVLFALLVRHRDHRLTAIIALVLLIGAAGVFLFKAYGMRARADAEKMAGEGVAVRARIWGSAWRMWQDHFWFGVGPGHFDVRYRAYREPSVLTQMRPGRVHNDPLNVLTDWGLIGGVMFALPCAFLTWGIFRTWPYVRRRSNDFKKKRGNKSAFVLGSAIGLLAMFFHSFLDFNLHIPANAILVVLLCALVTGHLRFATDNYWVTPKLPLKLGATAVLVIAAAWLGLHAFRHGREQVWLRQAEAAPPQSAARLNALQAAAQAEPHNPETAYQVGEALRMVSWRGEAGYEALATEAIRWFQRSARANPYDGYSYLRWGMCLHWLGRHAEAPALFARALELDPNGYYMRAHLGWHKYQLGDLAAAKSWFEASLELQPTDNPIAQTYLELIARTETQNGAQLP